MVQRAQDENAPPEATRLQLELMARAETLRRYVQAKIPPRFRALIAPEDVLQEVWIAAYSGYSTYKSARPDGLDRWLIGITNHKLIDSLKTAGRIKRGGNMRIAQAGADRRKSMVDLFGRLAASGRTPSREVAADEAANALQVALSQLPEERRLAIQMRHLEGLSLAEIAHRMQKTEAAVHSILFRGLRELRRRLGDIARYFTDTRSLSSGP